MQSAKSLVAQVIKNPAIIKSYTLAQWDTLISQGRRSDLLGRLCRLLEEGGLLDRVPDAPRQHLISTRTMADKHEVAVGWEVKCIHESLRDQGIPTILLKGAAYVVTGLPSGWGRLFFDVDIMVPKAALESTELALYMAGYVTTHTDDYDQRYYRQWMHELPPLIHVRRKTLLDVHHTILPETAHLHPDPQKLIAAAVRVDGFDELYVLSPVDMVLHSMTHLFHDGELERGLRDIADLDALLRHFGREQNFWDTLVSRAQELELGRPLFYGLRYTSNILGTPIPEDVIQAANVASPSRFMLWLMDAIFMRGLEPDHPTCDSAFTGLARWLLYIRSHYLRMPFYLLIPHLVRKAWKRRMDPSPVTNKI